MPVGVTTHSPWRDWRPSASRHEITTGLTGAPAYRCANTSLQPMSKPQFAGCNGAIAAPRSRSHDTHAPSDPSCGQLPPPRASSTASAVTVRSPVGVENTSAPPASQPVQRWCTWNTTPLSRSRRTHARSIGAAFMSIGNTRPELPTKVSKPSSRVQARNASASNAASHVATSSRRSRYRAANSGGASECVRFRPPLPAIRNLRPTEPLLS